MRDEAIATAERFIEAFNAQRHEALADALNYPHVRLANGTFTTIADREAFLERSRGGAARLVEEGWHHSVVETIEAVHVGTDKVHLVMTVARCHADGTIYNRFDTLWIATCMAGRWGIQFRSSFLR